MRRLSFVLAAALGSMACEEPQRTQDRKKVETTIDFVAQGRAQLSAGRPDVAVREFKQAISASPEDASLYLLLAEAYRASGNEAGATLTLKQAESVSGVQDPSIRRQRAEMLLKMRQEGAALKELSAMREADLLTDPELLDLTRLLARARRFDEAFKTLERIQLRNLDDPEAKTMEAEILLLKGDVLVAAKIMDRLLAATPSLTSARLLRARYFLNERELDHAEEDVNMVDPKDARRVDVVTLRARVLTELGRIDEAAAILERLLDEDPKNADVLGLMAETRLAQGKGGEAQVLVDKILSMEPQSARALYVRGRALEQQGRLDDAISDFRSALLTDAAFTQAYKRLWRIYDKRGDKADAMDALEELYRLNDLDASEKVQLARYYSETWANVPRGQELINDALKKDPKNADYLKIKAKLGKGSTTGKKKTGGIEIIRGR